MASPAPLESMRIAQERSARRRRTNQAADQASVSRAGRSGGTPLGRSGMKDYHPLSETSADARENWGWKRCTSRREREQSISMMLPSLPLPSSYDVWTDQQEEILLTDVVTFSLGDSCRSTRIRLLMVGGRMPTTSGFASATAVRSWLLCQAWRRHTNTPASILNNIAPAAVFNRSQTPLEWQAAETASPSSVLTAISPYSPIKLDPSFIIDTASEQQSFDGADQGLKKTSNAAKPCSAQPSAQSLSTTPEFVVWRNSVRATTSWRLLHLRHSSQSTVFALSRTHRRPE